MQTQNKITGLKRLFLAGALGLLVTLVPSQSKAFDMPRPYVQSTLASALVSPAGTSIDDACRQDWISVNPIKNLELGIWQNQFLNERSITERDYCATYSIPVTSNLTASAGFQYWDYPNERFGNFDSVETLGLNYSGAVNANVAYAHLNHNSATEAGDRFCASLSKPITLVDGKAKITLTPSLSSAVNNNFYGNNGLAHITPGVKLGVSYKNANASAFFNVQRGISQDIQNINFGGVSLGFQF